MDHYYVYRDGNTTVHVRYEAAKEKLHLYGVNDSTELMLQNAAEREGPNNGFTRSREGACGRKVASIDPVVYRLWQKEFEGIGGKNQSDWVPDWHKFLKAKLAQNPQFYTVKNLVTHNANDGKIIIR